MAKVLALIDYVKKDYCKLDSNGNMDITFFNTPDGKLLNKILKGKRSGLGLSNDDIDIQFFHQGIPKYNSFSNSYYAISKKELNKDRDNMIKYIKKTKPEIVLCFGAQAYNTLLDNKDSYMLSDNSFDGYTCKTAPMPHLDRYLTLPQVSKDEILAINRLIKRYLSGDKELKPKLGNYKLITKWEDVEYIFNEQIPKYDAVAVDFETNTLKTWLKGSKVLCISLSWREHMGVTIPINHSKLNCWTDEQESKLKKYIVSLLQSNKRKVFHNAKFDIRMCMDLLGLKYCTNVVDTMMMYYVGYNELPAAPKGLKHLAMVYTDLGDYEKPRDEYFDKYLENHYNNWVKEQEEKGIKPLKKNYQPPKNKVDGGKIDFEWLPMEIIYPYASADTDVTIQLYHIFKKKIDSNNRWKELIYSYYPRLTDALCWIEHTGIYLNPDKVKAYKEKYDSLFNDTAEKIYAVTPEIKDYENEKLELLEKRATLMKKVKSADRTKEQKEFIKQAGKYMGKDSKGNPKYKFSLSSKQQLAYLFIEMRGYTLPLDKDFLTPSAIKARKQNKPESIVYSDFKMDNKVLKYIAKEYKDETAKLLIKYSDLLKAKTAFVDALPKLADDNNLIHAKFNITGCIKGDSLMLTEDGIVPIESISNNRDHHKFSDLGINIYTGKQKAYADKFFYSGVTKTKKITLANGQVMETTYNHPLLINNYYKDGRTLQNSNKAIEKHMKDNSWITAENIKEGMYVNVALGSNMYGKNVKLPSSDTYVSKSNNAKKVIIPHELTAELAELLGTYIADGSYSISDKSGSYHIGITNDDEEVIDRICKLVKSVFGFNPYVYRKEGKSPIVYITGKEIVLWLINTFNLHSKGYTKVVPNLILKSPKDIQQAFLKGLTLDSSVLKKKYPSIYLCTTSYKQAHAVSVMLINMGIYNVISKRKSYAKGKHSTYDIMITLEYAKKFVDEVGFIEIKNKENIILNKLNKGYKGKHIGCKIFKEYCLVRINKVEESIEQPTYDIQVPNYHSFVANGVINHNTATGRLSSSDPNLQQVKKPTSNYNADDYGWGIKGMYTSRFKNGLMVNFDYKSLEVFLAALFAKDGGMAKALANGLDIHKRNASVAFNIPYEEVTTQQRFKAKSVSFGVMYGMGVLGLSERLGESKEEAQKTQDKVLGAMPEVKKSIQLVNAFVEKYGYVQTLNGNYRRLPDAKFKSNRHNHDQALRQAFNACIQGSGPRFTNWSIIFIREWLRKNHMKSQIVATVHDSILLDVHPDEVQQVLPFVKHTMENLPLPELKASYKQFNLKPSDIPEKYHIDNEHFRFALFAEFEGGSSYADEIEIDPKEIYDWGTPTDYVNVNKYEQEISDYYDTLLENTPEEEHEKILEEKEESIKKWKSWKESKKIK